MTYPVRLSEIVRLWPADELLEMSSLKKIELQKELDNWTDVEFRLKKRPSPNEHKLFFPFSLTGPGPDGFHYAGSSGYCLAERYVAWHKERLARSMRKMDRITALLTDKEDDNERLDPEEVKERVIMRELIESYMGKAPRRNIISCPFHQDKRPSFSMSDEKGLWYCHAEGRGGDAISFVQEMDNCSFKDALHTLNDMFP